MLSEFDESECIALQLNLQRTIFMRNGWVSDAPFTLSGTDISECTSYVSLGREINMKDNLTPELGKRKRAAWREHRGCSEEDEEHPAPCSPLQHLSTSCFDLCFRNLGTSQAGRKRGERH